MILEDNVVRIVRKPVVGNIDNEAKILYTISAKYKNIVTKKSITYQTQDNVEIHGTLFVPDASNGYAIICLHQFQLERSTYDHIASKLCDAGITVLSVDLRGHGESVLQQGAPYTFGTMTEDDFRKIPGLDIEAAKKYLTEEVHIDAENVGLMGASIGANASIISAGRNPQTAFVVALSPGLDYRGIQPGPESAQIQKPALIVAAKDDTYSAASSAELFQHSPSSEKDIKIVEGGEHGTNLLHDEATEAMVVTWITRATR